MNAKEVFLTLVAANIPCLGLLALSGWFAYLDNGYWGWPFAIALLTMHSLKTAKDRFNEEKEQAIERQKLMKKYGDDLFNKV